MAPAVIDDETVATDTTIDDLVAIAPPLSEATKTTLAALLRGGAA